MNLQMQWSLDHTASSTLSIARGIIEAATKDNIQPLALLACERFGATLAMCPETCRKIEDLVQKTKPPAVISFLSAVVGYSPTDCASQLVRSLAGVQFLGLAASLVTSIGSFQGGNAIAAMLVDSAADKTLLPTPRQLGDLLTSVEHRCVRSGFADSVLGYHIFLTNSDALSGTQAQDLWKGCALHPEPEGVAKLVGAFRQLSRIGDAQQVILKTTACAPWVVAFTKWCLGHPPSIYFEDGHPLLEQSALRVTVIVSRSTSDHKGIDITVYRNVDTPAELVRAHEVSEPYSSMISIESYGRWLLRHYELASNTGFKAIHEAIPYALKQAVTLARVQYGLAYGEDMARPSPSWSTRYGINQLNEPNLQRLRTNMFAPDSVISEMAARFLNLEQPLPLMSLDEGLQIDTLPLMELYISELKGQCSCPGCALSNPYSLVPCLVSQFFKSLASLVADIIALSLFDYSEPLLVHMNHERPSQPSDQLFADSIFTVLRVGRITATTIQTVLDWTLNLIGHEVPEDWAKAGWVISSFRGQAAYPKLYETQVLKKRGFLTLTWAPGLLLHNGSVYTRGQYGKLVPSTKTIPLAGMPKEVNKPINLAPSMKTVWRVTPRATHLQIELGLDSPDTNLSFVGTSALTILRNMSVAMMMDSCPHDPNVPLSRPDLSCDYFGPLVPSSKEVTREDVVREKVVAVAGSSSLRLFALSSGFFLAILRGNACLSCCLEEGRRFGYSVIIC